MDEVDYRLLSSDVRTNRHQSMIARDGKPKPPGRVTGTKGGHGHVYPKLRDGLEVAGIPYRADVEGPEADRFDHPLSDRAGLTIRIAGDHHVLPQGGPHVLDADRV